MKLVISALSLESEEDIDVSAQKRSVISSLPKQIWLLAVVKEPPGESDLPEFLPKHRLLLPVLISLPA